MLSYLIAYLGAETCFAGIAFKIKKWRNNDVSSIAAITPIGLALPVWLIALSFLLFFDNAAYPIHYFLYFIPWLGATWLVNFGPSFLYKYQGLAENTILQNALGLFMALIADILLFGIHHNFYIFIGIALSFSGGLLLNRQRKKEVETERTIPIQKLILATVFLASLGVVNMSLFKQAVLIIDNFYLHAVTAGCGVAFIYLTVGWKSFKKAYTEKKMANIDLLAVVIFLVIGMMAESYAYQKLSIVLLTVLVKIAKTVVFLLSDLKHKELRLNKEVIFALGLMISGTILIYMYS